MTKKEAGMDKKFWSMIVLTLGLVLVVSTTIQAHEPDVKSVDYAHPQKYLEILPSFGDRLAIKKNASKLKGLNDLETIGNVVDWMKKNLRYNDSKSTTRRNYDDDVREREWGSCADYSIVCGALLRGAGIPVIWVKTLDVSFIWAFLNNHSRAMRVEGHVFLEVYVDVDKKCWALLDANAGKLYRKNYDPKMRILPGNRFAFDKGNDLYEMITSFTMDKYWQQIENFLPTIDKTLLPVDEKSNILLGH
jgi:hypothetical protein